MYLDTIFNDIFETRFSCFNRPVLDRKPCTTVKTEYGYKIIINTLGMSEDDVHVSIENGYIIIKGEKKMEDIDFDNTVNVKIYAGSVYSNIKKVEYSVKNGITYVDVFTEDTSKEIPINKK